MDGWMDGWLTATSALMQLPFRLTLLSSAHGYREYPQLNLTHDLLRSSCYVCTSVHHRQKKEFLCISGPAPAHQRPLDHPPPAHIAPALLIHSDFVFSIVSSARAPSRWPSTGSPALCTEPIQCSASL
ncbi:hypothetical protein B0T10DRAFT_480222, partial [Thelonectria olida]